ncbi:hypothetical protein ZWY2020_031803 [Hordeum vulgare]|nr:hypothetical protein ZWY2020_031803 [Hordeum vulgare]
MESRPCLSKCKIISGQSALFWKHNWEGESLQQKFPELHSFATNNSISLQNFRVFQDLTSHFHLHVSSIAFEQFNEQREIICQLDATVKDLWICNGSANIYSFIKMYKRLMGDEVENRFFSLIRSSSSFFFFLEKEDNPRPLHLGDACGHFIDYSRGPYKAVQQYV